MPRESAQRRRERAARIIAHLRKGYSDADCALLHRNALELLVATILSAQCTDVRVNKVTPELFSRYPDAASLAAATLEELETVIHSLGFFRSKSKSLNGLGKALIARHDGEVPTTMEELVELPGVGRKTANVVLGTWFGVPSIPVDTHVTRLTRRLKLTRQTDPVKIEKELQTIFDRQDWTFLSHALIWHGRRVCSARKPNCGDCSMAADCPGATTR